MARILTLKLTLTLTHTFTHTHSLSLSLTHTHTLSLSLSLSFSLSLSLSLSFSRFLFGLWRVRFPPCLVRQATARVRTKRRESWFPWQVTRVAGPRDR